MFEKIEVRLTIIVNLNIVVIFYTKKKKVSNF